MYEGRLPRRSVGQAAAQFLEIDPNWLWPKIRDKVNPDLINLYAGVHEVPVTIWKCSARSAKAVIDVAADAAPALPCDMADILEFKARQGVEVRLCVDSSVVPTVRIDGAWTRISAARTHTGVYRFDEEMFVWLNRAASGRGAELATPVLHLRHSEENGVFDYYASVFGRLWDTAEAVAHQGRDWYRATA